MILIILYIVDGAGKISMKVHELTDSIMGVKPAQHYRILFLTNQFKKREKFATKM